jgi:hypothetical protein
MKYVSIDIETTGLEPETDQILEFAAVYDHTEWWHERPVEALSSMSVVIRHDRIEGHPYALAMNARLIATNAHERDKCVAPGDLWGEFHHWLEPLGGITYPGKINVTGKNVAMFDLPFIRKIQQFPFHRRVLDPAMYFVDLDQDDVLPDMKTCLQRAGLPDQVSHEALDDAQQACRLIRVGMWQAGLYKGQKPLL